MIFALLKEIVALQVRFIPINVWEPSFQRPLTWAFIVRSGCGSQNRYKRSGIQNGPKDPLEVILRVSNYGEVGGARSNKRSDDRCNSGNKST